MLFAVAEPLFIVVYCPGSSAVQSAFSEELSTIDLFDVVATFQEAVFIVVDFNIHLERSDDPITKQLTDLICEYWISVRLTTPM